MQLLIAKVCEDYITGLLQLESKLNQKLYPEDFFVIGWSL
jgi:hypothetical protein